MDCFVASLLAMTGYSSAKNEQPQEGAHYDDLE
jgi:hypothetical protein